MKRLFVVKKVQDQLKSIVQERIMSEFDEKTERENEKRKRDIVRKEFEIISNEGARETRY